MGKTTLTYITQENDELSAGIEKLKSGELSASELDKLTENAKSLYEALIVLRYKAFEKHLGREVVDFVEEPVHQEEVSASTETEEIQEEPVVEEDSFSGFDLTGETEVTEEEPSAPTMFDFSGVEENEGESIAEHTLEESEKTEERIEQDDFDIHSFRESENTANTEDAIEDDSLNSQFKDNRDGSLRKQLGRTPISDLKSEIGIAKKFEYINSMFNGKTEMYDSAINELNSCGSDEAAKNLLNDYAKEFNWDLDDKSIIKFIELVERRYI